MKHQIIGFSPEDTRRDEKLDSVKCELNKAWGDL